MFYHASLNPCKALGSVFSCTQSMALAASCARSVFRSSSFRNVAAKVATEAKAARSPFRVSSQKSPFPHFFRAPVETSFCVESLLPYHTATASSLMTSMLSVSRRSYGWLSEAGNDDV